MSSERIPVVDKKIHDEKLDDTSVRYRVLAEQIPAVTYIAELGTNGRWLYVSSRIETLLGFRAQEWLADPTLWLRQMHPEDRSLYHAAELEAQKKGSFSCELRMFSRSGSEVWVRDEGSASYGSRHCLGFLLDITEKKRLELETKAYLSLLGAIQTAQSQFIADGLSESVFNGLLNGLLTLTSSEYGFIGEIFRSCDGAPYLKTHAITNIAWNEESRALYEKYAPNLEFHNLNSLLGHVMTTQQPVISNDPSTDSRQGGLPAGHPVLKHFLGLPLFHGGSLIGMVGIANRPGGYDEKVVQYLQPLLATSGNLIQSHRNQQLKQKALTDLETAQLELAHSERRLRTMIETEPECVKVLSIDGKLLEINAAGLVMIEADNAEQVIGQSILQLLKPEYRKSFADLTQRAVDGERGALEFEITGLKGTSRWLETYVAPLVDEKGAVTGVLGVTRDITQRKLSEQSLRNSEERYRTLFEESKDVVFISTPEGKLVDINQAGVDLFGFSSKEEALGIKHMEELYVYKAEHDATRKLMAEKGFMKDHEIELKRRDGKKLVVLETSNAVRNEEGKIVFYRGILRDITHVKELQHELLQSQKMEAVGRLAGGVAHDFNNILMALSGYSELLLLKIRDDDPLTGIISEMQKAVSQGAGLTQQLLAFSRKQVLSPKVLDLNASITHMENMLRRLIGEDIKFSTMLADSPGFIVADPGQVEQVILNLAVNSKDAMPQGGRFSIETGNILLDKAYASNHPEVKPGPYVMLIFSDTGTGMDEDTVSHIFEPFYTTKEAGKGTGLGLSTVYGIVNQSGGHIFVESQPGAGTKFYIYFPRVEDPQETRIHFEPDFGGLSRGETILLVDDNASIRKSLAALLEIKGYKVLQAENGHAALQIVRGESASIDLVITDVVMPEMSGGEMVRRISMDRPGMKVLFMSGYAPEDFAGHVILGKDVAFLSKPVGAQTLHSKIRELLDETS